MDGKVRGCSAVSQSMARCLDADHAQILLLPPDVSQWVPQDHPARFVWDLVEALDLEQLGILMPEGRTGRPAFSPKLMLRLWLYAWMDRTRATRAIEKRCLSDLAYIWLTGNLHPDHNTIWRFFKSNKKQLRTLFRQVVRVAVDAGLVGFALHALDGTKMQAACSTDTALHYKELLKRLAELDHIVAASMQQVEAEHELGGDSFRMPAQLADLEARKKAIREGLARLDAEQQIHLHPLEPEARMMKSRQGTAMAYNAQAVVDHDSDIIVAADLTSDENDHGQLVPMLDQVLETTGRVADETSADTGYYSGDQLAEAERRNYPVVVNVQPDSSGKGAFRKEYFSYDPQRDVYICPLGHELGFWRLDDSRARRSYRCTNKNCPRRGDCTSDKSGRTIKRTAHDDAMDRQKLKQKSPTAQHALELRKEIVEHVFGNMKWGEGCRRFTARGLEGARAQWALLCITLNLRRLYACWRVGRLQLAAAG
jgi:transposase